MKDEKNLVVSGFRFEGPEEAKQAELEQIKVNKIKEKLDLRDPEKVKLIYNKAIENNVFKTIIGYEYLKKLQNILVKQQKEEIEPIPIVEQKKIQEVEKIEYIKKDNSKEIIKQNEKSKKLYRYIIAVLLFLFIAMVVISMTGNRPTIINYERTLQNKYSEWAAELNERESTIREKERELNIFAE